MFQEEEMLKAKQLLCTRVMEERTKDGTSSIPTRYQKKNQNQSNQHQSNQHQSNQHQRRNQTQVLVDGNQEESSSSDQ